MRRHLPLVLAFLAGAALAAVVCLSGHSAPTPPADLSGEISVRRGFGEPAVLQPHSVHIDGRGVFQVEPARPGPVWLLSLDGGRVQIAATETVTRNP